MIYDPPQFISHYYHFVAETFYGFWMMYASLDPKIDMYGKTTLAAPARMLYPFAEEHRESSFESTSTQIVSSLISRVERLLSI